MGACWRARLLLVWCVAGCASAERGAAGGSLRGALEALQRRQRARADHPQSLLHYREPQDYEEALYELYGPPPQYDSDESYGVNIDSVGDMPDKYMIKYLNDVESAPKNYYDYKINKKKSQFDIPEPHKIKQSAFRERSLKHNNDNEILTELFMDKAEENEKKNEKANAQFNKNDAEYAILLEKLWSKYKSNHQNNKDSSQEGIVKLYKERTIKKRQYPSEVAPNTWGPVAFKRKRSPVADLVEEDVNSDDYPSEYINYPNRPEDRLKYSNDKDDEDLDSSYQYELPDPDKGDMREEYAIAFQPLDGDKISDLPSDGDEYSYDVIEKRFPVSKRSSGPYKGPYMAQQKRSADNKQNGGNDKKFRSGSGTDPKVIRDLSKIFGEPEDELHKSLVKRSNKHEENSHETKPPQMTVTSHNSSHDQNATHIHDDESHERHGIHPPVLSSNEQVLETHDQAREKGLPILLKKKSIDWSQYFGIDKRKKKSVSIPNDGSERFRKQYMDTFNQEVAYPLIYYRKHDMVKRDFIINKPVDESEFQIDSASAVAIRTNDKRNVDREDDSKLDKIDRKLKSMESVIVDEALQLSNVGPSLDPEEDEEMKEKMLSRLAAAYSLEKMRKALKDFKQSLRTQRGNSRAKPPSVDFEESKKKRIAIKKEKAELKHEDAVASKPTNTAGATHDEFEDEQGAGHYLNGATEEPYSEGYMGGSGRHHAPTIYQGKSKGECPVLDRIVQRCKGIDLLAGDQGQLFLPLCSLHQICYLCSQSAPTTCDLIFLSEADTSCDGDMVCQKTARNALMAMRELHETLVDDLDGECEASPCLTSTLRLNLNWNSAVN